MKALLVFAGSLLLAACAADESAFVAGCAAVGKMEPTCGLHNPEDIEVLPDRKTLLISQMGMTMEQGTPGELSFFDTSTRAVTPAFPAGANATGSAKENWGDASCPGNPGSRFSPHGISLRQRDDKRWQVAAVNHGGRETIEMFELLADTPVPRLEWRGCVVPPDGTFVNDVALRRNGGLVGSHMFDKHSTPVGNLSVDAIKAMLGMNTGHVFEWLPGGSLRVLAESHGAFINGVELSADESAVFANVYFGNEIRKLDRQTGKRLGSAAIKHADNLAWDATGGLLAVAHTGGLRTQLACLKQPGTTCALEYTVLRLNPDTMAVTEVLRHQGAPMGAATVARELDGMLYLGTYTGDRLVRMPYASAQ